MSWRDRFWIPRGPSKADLERMSRAVPLTPDDVTVLVTGYNEKARLLALHRPDIGGSDPVGARAFAASIMRAAGLAAHLGHETVPMAASSVYDLERTYHDLQKWAPHADNTAAFGLLEMKLQAFAAVASRNNWRYTFDHDAEAHRWVTPVKIDTMTRALQPGTGGK